MPADPVVTQEAVHVRQDLDAYYYRFETTGNEDIDLILGAVAYAGKAYHHTEDWDDASVIGVSCVDNIQNAANLAARHRTPTPASGDAGSVREGHIKSLHWNETHPSKSHPNWYARNFHTQFEARIDTSKALRWGKFPLSINGNMVDVKFDTAEQAKAYAQAEYETRMRQLLADVVSFKASAPTPDAAASEAGEFDRRPQIAGVQAGSEPSLRQMVRFYYVQHGQPDPEADTAAYFAALTTQGGAEG